MRTLKSRIFLLLMVLVFIVLQACAFSKSLRTVDTTSIDENASYTVILYGSRYSADMENLSILPIEGGKYTFEVYSPDFDYSLKKGVPAKDALKEAQAFLNRHHDYYRSIISKILDNEGNVIGYEVRPVYYPITFGVSDVLDVGYFIKNGKVIIKINLKPEIDRMLFDGDGMIRKVR